jgi:ABC-type glycerol-3-phosphate transport system substrate-binding protein
MNDQEGIAGYFSDVNPVFIEAVMLDGSLYNLPSLWAAAGIYYNKHLFDDAGVEHPTNDWTIDDFQAAARAISGLGDDIFGHAWPNRHWGGFVPWSFANDSNILVQRQSEGGDWLWDTFYGDLSEEEGAERGGGFFWPESMANDPNNVEALQMLMDLAFVDEASYASDFGVESAPSGSNDWLSVHRAGLHPVPDLHRRANAVFARLELFRNGGS